ncbi:integrase [Sulfitobacter sp. SK012]|uniref:tyrosine-type recombinase/integrase n=1 Tax=Sulfitobacter sp. SK012 TaxID=1389005 RepID=UPI000E0A9267|nr:site-specific integrase [Sulfitobacter sp. SK012]AXI46519.1 integrase [Sulfitobacter sp. SK012]
MPKRAKGLTAGFCSTVKAPGKHSDGDGLMLVVSDSGAKRWVQRLVIRGRRRDIGLGAYPLVPLAKARAAAAENRGVARAGGDPLARRDEDLSLRTFDMAMVDLLAKKAGELSNAKHIAQWESTLRTYAVPRLGKMRVSEITVTDIVEVLLPIWKTKNETASRLRGRIEAVFAFSTASGWRSGPNPATWGGNLDMLLPKPSKVKKVVHQPALQVRDAPFWFDELAQRRGSSARCLEFLALTWVRSGEARGAKWSEIDLDKAIWRIPASRTKTKEEQMVPLSLAAIGLLRGIPRVREANDKGGDLIDVDLVFVSPRGGQLSDMALSAVMRRLHQADSYDRDLYKARGLLEHQIGWLDERSGRPAVPHGLRSTARDWAGLQGYPRELAELSLGHRIGNRVEQAYHRDSLLERRRPMMEAWAQYLLSERSGHTNSIGLRAV